MTHWPRTLTDVIYRMFLFRRLTLVCSAIVWAGLVLSWFVHGGAIAGGAPMGVGIAAVVAVAAFALHSVLFPAGALDALALALVAFVFTLVLPFLAALHGETAVVAGVFLWGLGPLFLSCCFIWGLSMLHAALPTRQLQTQIERVFPVSAEALAAHEFIRPNMRSGMRRSGTADERGFFPVDFGFVFPNYEGDFSLPETPAERDPDHMECKDCHARIIEAGPLWQVSQYVMAGGASLVVRQEVEPLGPLQCRYRCEEVHDTWSIYTQVMAWLTDHLRDYHRHMVDEIRGCATPAVRALPQVTLMSVVARGFVRLGLAGSVGGRQGLG